MVKQLMSLEGAAEEYNVDPNALEVAIAFDRGELSGEEVEDLGYAQIIAALAPIVKKITSASNKVIGKVARTGFHNIASRVRSRRSSPTPTLTQSTRLPVPIRRIPTKPAAIDQKTMLMVGGGVLVLFLLLRKK